MLNDLESLPTAARRTVKQGKRKFSRITFWRYVQREPDLGVRIGGRHFMWRACREALNQGQTLAEAAEIGRRCHARLS